MARFTDEEMRNWIDNASYEDLFRKWRFAPVGDMFFQCKMGEYYLDVMTKRRREVGNVEHVRVSKLIGWSQ